LAWTVAAFAGAAAVIGAAGSLTFWRRWRETFVRLAGAREDVRRLSDALAGGGMVLLRWPIDADADAGPSVEGDPASVLGSADDSFAAIRATFDAKTGPAFADAVATLRADGTSFSLDLAVGPDRLIAAVGRRGAFEDAVWLIDQGRLGRRRLMAEQEAGRLRAMLDALPQPVWSRDESLTLLDCNMAYAEAVEAASPRIAVDDGRELAEGATAGKARNLARRAHEAGAAATDRMHVVVHGSRRLMQFAEAPATGGAYTTGYAVDLTPVEESRADLARHVAAHADVLEKLGTAIAVFGPDKRLQFFNSAFARLWDLDESWLHTAPTYGEVLEQLRENRMWPEYADFPAFKAEQLKLFTSLIEPVEELIHLPNENTLRMLVTPHPMGGLMFTYEDVTDRLALERSYNTLIAVQRETLNNLSEGVAVFGSDGRLKLSNPVFGAMWGLSGGYLDSEPHLSDVLDATRAYFNYGDDWEGFRNAAFARITGRMIRAGRISRTDGTELEYGIVPLPDGAALVSYLDITDSIRVERALRERTEALETADRLKSEFIANVSYELRTPLNTIIGFTELLDMEVFGPLNERQKEYSSGILDASNRLLALINDILDLATIEAGRMRLDDEDVAVDALVESVGSLVRDWARERELAIEFDVGETGMNLRGDERRLRHALYNLVSNAIKFTPDGGSIRVEVAREGNDALISVVDDGIGMSDEDRERAFDKFVRGKQPDGRAVGAGLGLSLVRSIIELHGGRIELDSAPETGTKVICRLPLTIGSGKIEDRLRATG